MTKPDKNFNMKRSTKTMISLMGANKKARVDFKHAMIDAQLCEEAARKQALKSKDTRNKGTHVDNFKEAE